MQARLLLAVPGICQDKQRSIEEDLLCFGHADMVLFVLSGIACIPIESDNTLEINHFCILPAYAETWV